MLMRDKFLRENALAFVPDAGARRLLAAPLGFYDGRLWGLSETPQQGYEVWRHDGRTALAIEIPTVHGPATSLLCVDSGVFAAAVSGTTVHWYVSTDGDAWTLATLVGGGELAVTYISSPLRRNVCDCGGGRLVMTDYVNTGAVSHMWASEDGGETWTLLFTTTANAIRHFHGCVWDAVGGKLYVMIGDSNYDSAILICDDLDDLIADGAAWLSRWDLDTAHGAGTEIAPDAGYAIVTGTQVCRTVDLQIVTFAGARHAYWIPDATGVDSHVYRAKLSTLAVDRLSCAPVPGLGWHGTVVPAADYGGDRLSPALGDVAVIGTASQSLAGIYKGSSDAYAHTVAVHPRTQQVVELARFLRSDMASADESPPAGGGQVIFLAAWGKLWGCGSGMHDSGPVGRLRIGGAGPGGGYDSDRMPLMAVAPQPNLVRNCNFGNAVSSGNWLAVGVGGGSGRDTSVVMPGRAASLKIVAEGADSYYFQAIDPLLFAESAAQNGFVTASAYVRVVGGTWQTGGRVGLVVNSGQDHFCYLRQAEFEDSVANGTWIRLALSAVMPAAEAAVAVRLFARRIGKPASPGTVYFSDVALTPGALPMRTPAVSAPPLFNYGECVIPAAATFVQVTHGLAFDPGNEALMVCPAQDVGGRNWWAGTVYATVFRMYVDSAAPAGGLKFNWCIRAR